MTLPVVIYINNAFLELTVTPYDDEYEIACKEDLFQDANGNQEFYFDIFTAYDNNHHYGLEIEDGVIFKRYPNEYSLTVALNEFIRAFILLDDFIISKDVIGNEDSFPL